MLNRELLEQQMMELPIVQYEYFKTEELIFTEKVRYICRTECSQYGKSWACPPGVGTVEECREKCLSYPNALLITTMTEVSDIANVEETLATRHEHEEVTRAVKALMDAQQVETYVLSTESCAICERCTYPDAPCRFPEELIPSVESYGIFVNELAASAGIPYISGPNTVTYFGLLLY